MAQPSNNTKRKATAAQTTVAPNQVATLRHVITVAHGYQAPLPVQVATAIVFGDRFAAAVQAVPAPSQLATVNVPNIIPAPGQAATIAVLVQADAAQTTVLPQPMIFGFYQDKFIPPPAQVAAAQTIVQAYELQFISAPVQVATASPAKASFAATQAVPEPATEAFARALIAVTAAQTTVLPTPFARVTTDDPVNLALANQAVPAPAIAQTATVTVSIATNQALPAPAQSATATATVSFTQSVTTAAPAQSATGALIVSAAASQAVPAPEQTAEEGFRYNAYTDPCDQIATATVLVQFGNFQALLPPTQIATVETIERTGSASQFNVLPASSGTAQVIVQAFAFGDVPLPVTLAAATVGDNISAVANQAIPAPAQAATTTVLVQATVAQAVPAPAALQQTVTVSFFVADQVIPAPAQVATALLQDDRSAAASHAIAAPAQLATVQVIVKATSSQTIPLPSQAATGLRLTGFVAVQLVPPPDQVARLATGGVGGGVGGSTVGRHGIDGGNDHKVNEIIGRSDTTMLDGG